MPPLCPYMGSQWPANEPAVGLRGLHKSLTMTLVAEPPVSMVNPGIHVFRLALVEIFMMYLVKAASCAGKMQVTK